ncbi:MAG: phosphate ABC transporter ATP-binding protein PstB [Brevinematales bacterium]|nr:phosphate ABC transporter ATP-binding protein PstB [Brevinematales bacterium]
MKNNNRNNNTNEILSTHSLNFWYGDIHVLKNINISIKRNKITALIGPSGCGKTTLLRTFNKMYKLSEGVKIEGKIIFEGMNIIEDGAIDDFELRSKIGMVFQKPNPFYTSIYNNVAFGPRLRGIKRKSDLDEIVERSLRRAGIWDEVKDRLNKPAISLSGGQQQRVCIARALAVQPEVLLMDEPTSALDPASTAKIEELIIDLAQNYTVVIVTHNMQQASRISDFTGFMLNGELIEFGPTEDIFTTPKDERTENYITGKFG